MKGRVVGINKDRCAVEVDSGITVFDILGSHNTEIGDTLVGDFETHGGEEFLNADKQERIDVFVEAWSCSRQSASELLRSV